MTRGTSQPEYVEGVLDFSIFNGQAPASGNQLVDPSGHLLDSASLAAKEATYVGYNPLTTKRDKLFPDITDEQIAQIAPKLGIYLKWRYQYHSRSDRTHYGVFLMVGLTPKAEFPVVTKPRYLTNPAFSIEAYREALGRLQEEIREDLLELDPGQVKISAAGYEYASPSWRDIIQGRSYIAQGIIADPNAPPGRYFITLAQRRTRNKVAFEKDVLSRLPAIIAARKEHGLFKQQQMQRAFDSILGTPNG